MEERRPKSYAELFEEMGQKESKEEVVNEETKSEENFAEVKFERSSENFIPISDVTDEELSKGLEVLLQEEEKRKVNQL